MWPSVYMNWLDLNLRLWRLGWSSMLVMGQRLDPGRFDLLDHPEFPRMALEKSEAAGLSWIAAAFAQQQLMMKMAWPAVTPQRAARAALSVYGAALRPIETRAHANARRLSR